MATRSPSVVVSSLACPARASGGQPMRHGACSAGVGRVAQRDSGSPGAGWVEGGLGFLGSALHHTRAAGELNAEASVGTFSEESWESV